MSEKEWVYNKNCDCVHTNECTIKLEKGKLVAIVEHLDENQKLYDQEIKIPVDAVFELLKRWESNKNEN